MAGGEPREPHLIISDLSGTHQANCAAEGGLEGEEEGIWNCCLGGWVRKLKKRRRRDGGAMMKAHWALKTMHW